MSNECLPDDVIFAMISLIPEEIKYITGDRIKMHQTIMNLKNKYSLLDPFIFSKKGIEPISPLLAMVVSRLIFSRILSYNNPDYFTFTIKEGARECIRKNITEKYFSKNEKKQLRNIADEFAKECGI